MLFVVFLVFFVLTIKTILKHDDEEYLTARTGDKFIVVKWHLPTEKAQFMIKDSDIIYQTEVDGTGSYLFNEGKHGELYTFQLTYIDRKKDHIEKEVNGLFVDFKEVSEIMLVEIETDDGKMPYWEKADQTADPSRWGGTIIKNAYKRATFNGIPIKIKVRGNTSAIYPQQPYKIKFQKKVDLLGLGKEYADKEWNLVSSGHRLKTYFGLHLSKLVGMEWEPRMRYVNLLINGDWQGVYMLTESIKRHPKRCNIDKTGYLIENDNYYWKLNKGSFHGKLLTERLEFVFKYPKVTSKSDPRFVKIKKEIEEIANLIERQSEEVENLIDIDNFFAWELAHELMGTWDAAGSNMFYYKYDDSASSKWKMGPVWDFDSIYFLKDNEYSRVFYWDTTYFPQLMKISNFKKIYKKKYFAVAGSVEEKMKSILEEAKKIPDLEKSRELNTKRLKIYRYLPLDMEIKELMEHLHNRIEWLNEHIAEF